MKIAIAYLIASTEAVSIGHLVTCSARLVCGQTDTQNDKPSTVTLAVHAHHGLIIGRAGASPPSRTTCTHAYMYLYVCRCNAVP